MSSNFRIDDSVESGLQKVTGGVVVEEQLAAGKFARFNFQPLFGVCACGKMLPVRLSGGLSIELTVADAADSVIDGSSLSYELQEMSIRCAIVRLDSALESSFANMLMQNKSLSLRFITHSCQAMVLQPNSTEMSISLTRAYSRLNGLFITFQGGAGSPAANSHQCTSFLHPGQFDVGGPVAGTQTHSESLLSWDVQIGATKWPETPAVGIPETYSLLRQATHTYDQSVRSLSIDPQSYATNSYIIGVGLQTSEGAFSGYNTRSGDLLTVRCRNMATDPAVNAAGKVYVTMTHEAICEISEGRVSVLD